MKSFLLLIVLTLPSACGSNPFGAKQSPNPTPNPDDSQQEHPCDQPIESPSYANVLHQADLTHADFEQASKHAVNGVRGLGESQGSSDVFPLDKTIDGSIIVSFSKKTLCNGVGSDIKVFENPFKYGIRVFIEPIVVSVSANGVTYQSFPHHYNETIGTNSAEPNRWLGFAGKTPVFYHEELTPELQVFTPSAGGDGFDIEQLEESDIKEDILKNGVSYIKLEAAQRVANPDGNCDQSVCLFPDLPHAYGGYADIDGVYGRYFGSL